MLPEQTSFLTEFLKLIPIVTGALLAVLGGAATQYLIHQLNAKREQTKLRREKAEVLVQSLFDHSAWLDEKKQHLLFSVEHHNVPSPLNKAWMVQKLYFPELAESLSILAIASHEVEKFDLQQRAAQLEDRNAWAKTFHHSSYMKVYEPYHEALHAAINMVARVVKTLVKT